MTTHLIIGGTGKTGRRVLSRLHERGATAVALARPEFDWADPATWSSVERPVQTAYLTYAPELALPGAPEAVADVAERVARAGARRIVLLSGRGEALAQHAEQLVAAAAARHGAEWAVVRCSFFLQNFDEGLMAEPIAAGELAFPADGVREPFVDADDIADVVVGLLLGEVPAGQVHELTGPELLTFAEATAAIAAATGREISYVPISTAAFVDGLRSAGLPEEEAVGLGAMFEDILDGHNAHVSDGVERALGRGPRSVTDYAQQAAATGAWAVAAARS